MKIIIMQILFGVFAILQIADLVLTWRILKLGGTETWKPTKWLMEKIGTMPALMLSKSAVLIAAAWVTFEAAPSWWIYALCALCAFFGWVAVNNFRALRRQAAK